MDVEDLLWKDDRFHFWWREREREREAIEGRCSEREKRAFNLIGILGCVDENGRTWTPKVRWTSIHEPPNTLRKYYETILTHHMINIRENFYEIKHWRRNILLQVSFSSRRWRMTRPDGQEERSTTISEMVSDTQQNAQITWCDRGTCFSYTQSAFILYTQADWV